MELGNLNFLKFSDKTSQLYHNFAHTRAWSMVKVLPCDFFSIWLDGSTIVLGEVSATTASVEGPNGTLVEFSVSWSKHGLIGMRYLNSHTIASNPSHTLPFDHIQHTGEVAGDRLSICRRSAPWQKTVCGWHGTTNHLIQPIVKSWWFHFFLLLFDRFLYTVLLFSTAVDANSVKIWVQLQNEVSLMLQLFLMNNLENLKTILTKPYHYIPFDLL